MSSMVTDIDGGLGEMGRDNDVKGSFTELRHQRAQLIDNRNPQMSSLNL